MFFFFQAVIFRFKPLVFNGLFELSRFSFETNECLPGRTCSQDNINFKRISQLRPSGKISGFLKLSCSNFSFRPYGHRRSKNCWFIWKKLEIGVDPKQVSGRHIHFVKESWKNQAQPIEFHKFLHSNPGQLIQFPKVIKPFWRTFENHHVHFQLVAVPFHIHPQKKLTWIPKMTI